jgi:Adenosine specific kinase
MRRMLSAALVAVLGLTLPAASAWCADSGMIELARKNAAAVGAGHSFILFLGDGFYPLNVLNTLKMVPEVCRIFCATDNPTWLRQGRAVASWAWTDSPRKASRTRAASSGGRISCGRSATSYESRRRVDHDRRHRPGAGTERDQ